jgi:PD-(D/E)XK endonuclease
VLTTNQKGAIAEAAITKAAFEMSYGVYRPAGEGGRYDLIFDTGEELLRIQCKWASLKDEVVIIRSYSTRRTRTGLIRKPYLHGEFDALAAYCADLDRCYLLPYAAINGAIQLHLRIAPARNNQHTGIRLASHYEFGARLAQTTWGP